MNAVSYEKALSWLTLFASNLHAHLLRVAYCSRHVRSGANAGRELSHDFVVLEDARATMNLDDGSDEAITRRPRSKLDAERYAIALWVSKENEQTPLQAVGARLDD